jgi:hypothetical protein
MRYTSVVHLDKGHLRAFAARPWALLEDAKREHIAERFRADPIAHASSIHALRDHLRIVRPDWPTAADLAADFEDHVALKRKLERVAVHLRDR